MSAPPRCAPWCRVAAGAAAPAALALFTCCGTPRSAGEAHHDPCAQVLPTAARAVPDGVRLVTVRLLSERDERQLLGVGPSPSAGPGTSPQIADRLPRACVVVYRGRFRPGDVPAAPDASGRYATAVVRVRPAILLRLLVTEELPPPVRR